MPRFLLAEVTDLDMSAGVVHTTKGERLPLRFFASGAHPRHIGFLSEKEDYQGHPESLCACDGEFFTGKKSLSLVELLQLQESVFLTKYTKHGCARKALPTLRRPKAARTNPNITVSVQHARLNPLPEIPHLGLLRTKRMSQDGRATLPEDGDSHWCLCLRGLRARDLW